MDSLNDFADALLSLIGPGDRVRPFVCDGSPLTCSVFIIGTNPASSLAEQFWTYWDDSTGFDKDRFMQAYSDSRRRRGKAVVSQTRNALEVLVKSCAPLRCLETNVFGEATATQAELLAAPTQGRSVLPFLVDAIKPKWIIAHGLVAGKAAAPYENSAHVVHLPHLRKCAHADLRRLGRRIVDSMFQSGALPADASATPPTDSRGTSPRASAQIRRPLDLIAGNRRNDRQYRLRLADAIRSVAREFQDNALETACDTELARLGSPTNSNPG
ncbi:hypothetical protein QZM25_33075 [Burkholderia contaminans]|uniref:hypothetical protein n=1 Tax=Burkholderia contaminans TaxID=488447 RepID=UPI00264B6288|nr:hypothetical protein [Burkholderia contaminans]MDN7577450.1 hypothetical protein [Burkholderia contaminans]